MSERLQQGLAWLRAFFLDPVDPVPVAWMRISLGLLLIATHLFWWQWMGTMLAPDALISAESAQLYAPGTFSLYFFVDTLEQANLLHALMLLPLVGLTVGWKSRLMCILALVVQVSWAHRAPLALNNGDRLLRLWCLYMATVPSGAALSVDAWLRRRKGLPVPEVPAVATRLIQLQLCIMYTDTGIAKALHSEWWSGEALSTAMAAPHFQRMPALNTAVIQSQLGQVFMALLTWTTLIWELLFIPLVIWRRTRPVALAMGLAFHSGIYALMTVGVFAPASMWAYLAFWRGRPPSGAGEQAGRLAA